MTVATALAGVDRAWTGAETSFATGFPAKPDATIDVIFVAPSGVETPLINGVHYSWTRAAVTELVTVQPIALPAAPGTLRIERNTPATQAVAFYDGQDFAAYVHEDQYDRAAMRDAELRRERAGLRADVDALFDTTLRVPDGEPPPERLPPVAQRAGAYLVFDAAGNPDAVLPVTGFPLLPGDATTPLQAVPLQQLNARLAPLDPLPARLAQLITTPYDFGAVGNGIADDSAAFAAAEAASVSVYVPPGNFAVSVPPTLGKTWGPGKCFIAGVQTYLHPRPGPVETIYASVFEPNVVEAVSATTALQRAINFAQDRDLYVDLQAGARYLIGAPGLTMKHGRSATDTKSYQVRLRGNGCLFRVAAGVRGLSIVPRCLLADVNTGRGDAFIDLSGIDFDGFLGPTTATGLRIGAFGLVTSNFAFSQVADLKFESFTSGNVLQVDEAKHIDFKNVVVRAGTALFQATTAGSFCGDFVFYSCEFNGTAAVRPFRIVTASSGQARGFHIHGTKVYRSGMRCEASGSSQIGDIWFFGTQWDGPGAPAGERAIDFTAIDTARIFQIHFVRPYFVNYTGPAIFANSSGSASIRQFVVDGCGLGLIQCNPSDGNAALYFVSVESLTITGLEADSITKTSGTASVINIDACENVMVNGNNVTRSATIDFGISIGGGNRHMVRDNKMNVLTNVLNDYTGGTPIRSTGDNLLT